MNSKLKRAILPLTLIAMFTPLGTNLATGDSAPAGPKYDTPSGAAKLSPVFKATGVDPNKQQRGAKAPSGRQIYRSTNGETICITGESGAGHCNAASVVDEGKVFGGEMCIRGDLPEHLTRIFGAVPAAAVKVVLTTGAGTTYEATPVIGTVAFEVPRDEAGATDHVDITWTLDGGKQKTVELPMPPFIRGTNCA